MACDPLAHRRERVTREFFEDVVQSMHRLFRERPRHRCVVVRGASDTLDIEEECLGGHHSLHKDRSGSSNECRRAEQITDAYIPHGDLTAVGGMHVDAKQTLYKDGQSFCVRFRVHSMASRALDDPSADDQRFDGCNR